MNNRKKQTAVVAMATVLSVTTIASPMAVMAQENAPAPPAIMQDENQQQKTAPEIILPENLQATAGTALEEISLPEGWAWVENSTVITAETEEYPARFSVDDVTYDYSSIEGYNAEVHYVERKVVITVEPAKSEPEKPVQVEPVQEKANKLLEDSPTTLNAGDIEINETNFPDKGFRDWLKAQPYGTDETIDKTEIAGIKTIDVSGNVSIKDLTGIEHFTALETLVCFNTGITSLNVSNNTALQRLYCYNTGITKLDVRSNKELTSLNCSNTKIESLNVSNNTALTNLRCYNTGITSLDVSTNTALERLYCYNNTNLESLIVDGATALTHLDCESTGITSLDVSTNTALENLYCSNTGIKSLDVRTNTALESLYCYNTGITSLDVSTNTALESLYCYNNTNLESLIVDGATALTHLDCESTGITSLDVSTNTALKTLLCSTTGITSLDVSTNTALEILHCYNTGITSLDVSTNTALEYLYCNDTPLAYLNIGANNNLITLNKNNLRPVNVEVTSDSFKMADKFTGIDINKISNVTGATYSNGIMSNYTTGTPITYRYACGSSFSGAETIDVTLNITDIRAESTISITEDLNKAYDGNAVSATPKVNTTGSKDTVSYKWEQKKNNNWEDIASAPTDAGTYRVTATLASDNDYKEATSAPVEFTISQATNSWTESLAIKGWTYGEKANPPTAKASFGNVVFTYSNSKFGTYTDKVPTNAGTWYVKATVTTDNYKTLETVLAFTIAPKSADNNSQITIPSINSDKDVENLVIKDGDKVLEKGTDYEVEKKQDGNKTTVTITFKGNYTGTITKTYTVAIDTPKDEPKKTENIQTGDHTQTGLLATISLLSVGSIAFLTGKKEKKSIKNN